MAIQVKISQATRMITAAIKAGVVPILKGSPGIGKSQIVHQIAQTYNLKVIDLRLSQCDPTDLAGFPTIIGDKADYLPMAHFPIEGDPMPRRPDGLLYDGWALFLDEMTSAPPAIQAASYKLALDRMIGTRHLHKKCAVIGAGNLDTDGAIVHAMSTALQSRLIHLELVVDHAEWLAWAELNGFTHRITSYLKYRPDHLYTFSADHTDCTYACPRTWEFANRLLGVMEEDSPDLLPLLSGTISEGITREFLVFCKIFASLLTVPQIVADPENVKVPVEPGILFALTGSISHNMNADNATGLMKFVARLPAEFQVVCLREVVRKHKALLQHPAIQKWVAESATSLF